MNGNPEMTFLCSSRGCDVDVDDVHKAAGRAHAAKMQREAHERGEPHTPYPAFLDRYAQWMEEGEEASRLNLSVRDYTAIMEAESVLARYGISTVRPAVLRHEPITPDDFTAARPGGREP
jgi:hypothetical protein